MKKIKTKNKKISFLIFPTKILGRGVLKIGAIFFDIRKGEKIMGFVNENGENISYECSELIEELKEDILEFGGDTIVNVWCKDTNGVTIYTNYDFIEKELSLQDNEVENCEYIKQMSMTALIMLLEMQNNIL